MICPMILQGLMANPSITSTDHDGDFTQTFWGVEADCAQKECAFWTGEQCAVVAIAKNTVSRQERVLNKAFADFGGVEKI